LKELAPTTRNESSTTLDLTDTQPGGKEASSEPRRAVALFRGSESNIFVPFFFSLICAAMLSACTWTDKSGTRRVVIIGFGIISETNEAGISARDSRVIGGLWEKGGGGIGFIQQHRMEIDPERATNDLIAVRATPTVFSFKHARVIDFTNSNHLHP
jgi:hypothetical protein